MIVFKQHRLLIVSLGYLWIYSGISEFLLAQGWNRAFYFSTFPCSLALLWSILYVGEGVRRLLRRYHGLPSFYSGMNWVIAEILGITVLGNLAIIASVLSIAQAWHYALGMSLLSLIAAPWIPPHALLQPFFRIRQGMRRSASWTWIWWIPGITFALIFIGSAVPVSGTEQLHNTLPYAKYLLRGIDFNQYNLDNHFLLLGTYETLGVFIRAFAANDFAFHIVAQQVTALLAVGGIGLALGTLPWLLRRLPPLAALLMTWPAVINFAPVDIRVFKPDWIGILAAAIATACLFRQWAASSAKLQRSCMISVVLFSAMAACVKLTALPYVVFLLVATVSLSVIRQRALRLVHIWMPILFLGVGIVFFGKNALWLGNPLFPGFQNVFSKPERLADTTTFNTFQINKETQKKPDFLDYLGGYSRFWKFHPEFLIPVFLLGWLVIKRIRYPIVWLITGFFLSYVTLMNFYFYPSIYPRYVAFVFILLLLWTILLFLRAQSVIPPKTLGWFLVGFGLLMGTHATPEVHFKRGWDWWGKGVSPQDYRIERDPLDQLYFSINARCDNPGRLLNWKWRNYYYANFDVVNLEDLGGSSPDYYDKFNIQFVITEDNLKTMDILRQTWLSDPWFIEHFRIVNRAEHLLLWKRLATDNKILSVAGCQREFPLESQPLDYEWLLSNSQ